MRFITEQELQLKNRQKSIERFLLTKNERLTPGAKQFLTDPCNENEKDQPIELSEISEVQIFQPGGKVALKLRRAIIYAKTIQTCVTLEQQAALEQLIYLIAKEIEQLEKL